MSFPSSPTQHPVLGCVAALGAALDDVAHVDPMYMATTDKATALVELTACLSRLAELRLRMLASADDIAAEHGARDAAAWLAHQTHADDGPARRDLRLARALARRPGLAEAMRAGRLDPGKARIIDQALTELPRDLEAGVLAEAEGHLIGLADHYRPRELRHLGRKLLQVVAPEVDDAHEAKLLDDEEARAAAETCLTTRRRGDGTTDIAIRCADAIADRLLTYLESLTSPRRPDEPTEPEQPAEQPDGQPDEQADEQAGEQPGEPTGSGDDDRTYPQKMGEAFAQLMEDIDPARLPLHGGDATTVIVTIDLQTLLTGVGVALLGDQPITAAHARRLACRAHLIPAVLDGDSVILDQGRAKRLYDHHQRKALALRDKTCRATGCTIPAAWCEAHHLTPWSQGGRTDLADGVLLCSHHHHRAHDPRYDTTLHPDRSLTFHRRQ